MPSVHLSVVVGVCVHIVKHALCRNIVSVYVLVLMYLYMCQCICASCTSTFPVILIKDHNIVPNNNFFFIEGLRSVDLIRAHWKFSFPDSTCCHPLMCFGRLTVNHPWGHGLQCPTHRWSELYEPHNELEIERWTALATRKIQKTSK